VKHWSDALQLLIVGFYVPLSLLMPTGIGFWLDRRAGHELPSYALMGLAIGTVIMVYGVYRMVKPFLEEAKADTGEKQGLPPLVKRMISRSEKYNKEKEGQG
jgi:hypothetical protein